MICLAFLQLSSRLSTTTAVACCRPPLALLHDDRFGHLLVYRRAHPYIHSPRSSIAASGRCVRCVLLTGMLATRDEHAQTINFVSLALPPHPFPRCPSRAARPVLVPFLSCLHSNGGADMLAKKYQGMMAPQPRPGHSLTLTTNLDNPTVAPEQLLKRYTSVLYCCTKNRVKQNLRLIGCSNMKRVCSFFLCVYVLCDGASLGLVGGCGGVRRHVLIHRSVVVAGKGGLYI